MEPILEKWSIDSLRKHIELFQNEVVQSPKEKELNNRIVAELKAELSEREGDILSSLAGGTLQPDTFDIVSDDDEQ